MSGPRILAPAVAALGIALLALSLGAGAAQAATTVRTLHFATKVGPNNDISCDVVGDLYTPSTATKATPAPAILTTNGFGGSKDDQADLGRAFAARGYVVLSYSGLGFGGIGGSGCKITLDDRDYDGKAASQLVTFLGGGSAATDGTRIDYVARDARGSDGRPHPSDPRVGMIGGSYGGQIQFAVAGIDPRVDTLVPIITWNDLSYSLAPNNTSFTRGVTYATPGTEKQQWTSLFFGVGIGDGLSGASNDPSRNVGCPNFDNRACTAKVNLDTMGYPDAATLELARHASVTSFMDQIRVPTLIAQGEADTLFNLQESVATYRALRAQGTPVKLLWQSWGHSHLAPAPGELDMKSPEKSYEGRVFISWFDHYLKGAGPAPRLDFSYFRDWITYTGDAEPAYASAPDYPTGGTRRLFLSGADALVDSAGAVAAGSASFTTPAAGAPTSYSETSAVEPGAIPPSDAPGTFAAFTSTPFGADTDVVGVPTARITVSAPTASGAAGPGGLLLVFAKLYDVAPDGSVTLVRRLISPVRAADLTKPIDLELPGVVHRYAKGHRVRLVIAGSDAAYKNSAVATPVTVTTDRATPGVLTLPVVGAADQRPAPVPSGPATPATPPRRPAAPKLGIAFNRIGGTSRALQRRYRGAVRIKLRAKRGAVTGLRLTLFRLVGTRRIAVARTPKAVTATRKARFVALRYVARRRITPGRYLLLATGRNPSGVAAKTSQRFAARAARRR